MLYFKGGGSYCLAFTETQGNGRKHIYPAEVQICMPFNKLGPDKTVQ